MAIENFTMEMEKQELLGEQINDAMESTEEECTDEDVDRLIDQLTAPGGGGPARGGGLGLNNLINQEQEEKKDSDNLDDLENRLADLKK